MRAGYGIGRISDLEKGDWLEVRCACGHVGLLNPVELRNLRPLTKLQDLEPRYRCRKCLRRGRVVVAVLNNR